MLVLAGIGAAWGGPWVRPAGGVYAKVGAGAFRGTADFVELPGRFAGDAVEAYGEVGVGRGIELDLSTSYGFQRVGEVRNDGLQDLQLVTKWSPGAGRAAFALLGGARIPLYDRDGAAPELGPGGADLLAGGSVGRGIGPAWTLVDVILRHRLGAPSAGLDLRGEIGAQGASPVGGAVGLEIQPAFGRTAYQAVGTAAPVPRMLALSAKAFGRLPLGFGVTADAGWLPDLINDGPGYRVGAGVTWERSP
jgi:hypothetical protein